MCDLSPDLISRFRFRILSLVVHILANDIRLGVSIVHDHMCMPLVGLGLGLAFVLDHTSSDFGSLSVSFLNTLSNYTTLTFILATGIL